MRPLYLTAWALSRLVFRFLWALAEPVGELTVWLKHRALA